jgi:hypothetical protein
MIPFFDLYSRLQYQKSTSETCKRVPDLPQKATTTELLPTTAPLFSSQIPQGTFATGHVIVVAAFVLLQ